MRLKGNKENNTRESIKKWQIINNIFTHHVRNYEIIFLFTREKQFRFIGELLLL